jgi:hypothetical protein
MKKSILKLTALLLMAAGVFTACSKEPLLDDELISSNLLKMSSFSMVEEVDPTFLAGEWNLIKFAYTEDGVEISYLDDDLKSYNLLGEPNYSRLDIFVYTNELGVPIWLFGCESQFRVEYSFFSPNLIKLSLYQISFDLNNSPKQKAIVSALNNAHSFAIKDDELIIYFTGEKNKNLLIFKK